MNTPKALCTRYLIALLIILPTYCILPAATQAQTWDEIFRQKKTQKKYLAKQIALLHLYLDHLKKGYEIASKGLNTIHNIKNGDFNLHRDFFGSLQEVNPHIANTAKVADIIAFQVYIIRDLKKVNQYCASSTHFTPEEVRYVAAVYHNMLFLLDVSVSELFTILRPQDGQMKDDERIARINTLYTDVQDKHTFVQTFRSEVYGLAAARNHQQQAITFQRQLL